MNKQNIADNKTAIDKNTTAIARKIFLMVILVLQLRNP